MTDRRTALAEALLQLGVGRWYWGRAAGGTVTARRSIAALALWLAACTAPRTGQASIPAPLESERIVVMPDRQDVAVRPATDRPVPSPVPYAAPASPPSPSPIGTRPAETAKPATVKPSRAIASGYATWYDAGPGLYAAAGPALRAALGKSWRGRIVWACRSRCVRVRLSDWCACGSRNGRGTVIDLSRDAFSRIAAPSRGVVLVTMRTNS